MRRTALVFVLALAGVALSDRVAAQHPSDALFDPAALRTIRLTLLPEHWDALVREVGAGDVYPCTFEWQGQKLDRVGVLDRGQRSSAPGTKPSLRFQFDRFMDQKLLGLTRLDAEAMRRDPAMLRERLVYDVFRRRAVITPRAMHVRLEVNGAYAGLYTIVDELDQAELLALHFPNANGNLYRAVNRIGGDATLTRGFDPRSYMGVLYQWLRQATAKPDDLLEFLYIVNFGTDSELEIYLHRLIDVNSLLEYCAINEIVGNEDWMFSDVSAWTQPVTRGAPWGDNFDWYFAPSDGRCTVIVRDADLTMSSRWTPEGWVNRSIFSGLERSVLSRRLIGFAEWRNSFVAKVTAVLDTVFDPVTVVVELDRIYAQIRTAAEQDTSKPWTNQQFHAEVAALRRDLPLRVASVRVQLGCPGETFTRYGRGCPGSGATPAHDGAGLAVLGRTFSWRLRDARADANAVLLVGASAASVDLAPIGMAGCRLLVDLGVDRLVRTSADGTVALPLALPDDASLLGARLFSQFAVADPGAATPLKVVASNGLETRIGQCR